MSPLNGDIEITRSPREQVTEWTGRVPKPSAVLALQVTGAVLLVAAAIAAVIGITVHLSLPVRRIVGLVALMGALIGPFSLASGWARPMGLILGVVGLSFLTALFPIGTAPAAIVGFLAIKNRDHVRDYYRQGMKRGL